MTTSRAHRCLEPGLSIIVGAVDAHGTPSCCRSYAIKSDDDLQTLTIYLPVATSHDTIKSLAVTGRVAVAATHPMESSATQLKGTTLETRLAREDEAAFLDERLEAFSEMVLAFGVPRRLSRAAAYWPAFAVRIKVEEIYEQTPGPKAGTRLR